MERLLPAAEDRDYAVLQQRIPIARTVGFTHNDTVDAVAGSGALPAGHDDGRRPAKVMRDEERLWQIEDFLEGFNQPTA